MKNTIKNSMKDIMNKIDFDTMKIKESGFSDSQKELFHLIDKRFFPNDINPYQSDTQSWEYITPVDLREDYFHLHPFLDPRVLEVGAKRRFPKDVNRYCISEKYFEDKWVSEGNNQLSLYLEEWVKRNLQKLQEQDTIKLLDIGPAGGAITTLFALRALDRYDLLDKVEIYLLDIVPDVIEITKDGDFVVPNEMIEEYQFDFAGKDGKKYKEIIRSNRVHGIVGDGEVFPKEIHGMDISIVAYTHHHMNFLARKEFSQQMEDATKDGGFIGVVDFYKTSYEDYMNWYKPHFEKHQTPPPVEYPLLTGEILASWYRSKLHYLVYMENTFVFWLEK